MLVLATEVVTESSMPMTPGHDTWTDCLALTASHVTLVEVLPEKVILPNRAVPFELVVAVSSAVGQVVVSPPSPAEATSLVSVEVNESLVLTGVTAAWAGMAAIAYTVSIATLRKRLRLAALVMVVPFWVGSSVLVVGFAGRGS